MIQFIRSSTVSKLIYSERKPYSDCLWEGGVGWGLTGKLQKGSFLGDKNPLYFNRWGLQGYVQLSHLKFDP